VLFIGDAAGPGRAFHTILKFLDPRVIHRTVVLPRRGPASDRIERARAADEVIIEPNLAHDFMSLRFVGNAVRAAAGFTRLSRLAKRGGYDLIYCNGTVADLAGGILSAATSVPALWHVRYTSIPGLVAPIHRFLSASAGVRRIVCVSRAATALFSHCREKIRVLHNAVDTDEFSPSSVEPRLRRELGISSHAVVFGSHEKALGGKGSAEFLLAAKLALSRMSSDEAEHARFVVVSDAPGDLAGERLAECRKLARASGVGDKVHFVGGSEDVRPYVADFDVAVVTSVSDEPMPRSVMESMAMGKPVIGFDVGGVRELIDDGVTGALVASSPPDVGELAARMLHYQRHPDLRARQGAAARSRVERSFDARRQAYEIQKEIVGIVGESQPC
jgi:glycosyltransferase involved in cell wall biosynthesis